MKICVCGLWHLGTVTAACLADAGFTVTGLDFDLENVKGLGNGRPPVFEPGLEALLKSGVRRGRLRFSADPGASLRDADVVWVTYDTPVDGRGRADTGFVRRNVTALFPYLPPQAMVLISSQVPVGFTGSLEKSFAEACPGRRATFAYSPENLKLGGAIESFKHPARIVVGTKRREDRERLFPLIKRLCKNIIWMSTESAEMTKHAINAFLAASVAFANEIAVLCETAGADAREVELGLKSDERIGFKAYLSPGAAFAGGTLARDLAYLTGLGRATGQAACLLEAVQASNERHRHWPRRKILEALRHLNGKKIAVLGLAYKPYTDTLRGSEAVELCRWLAGRGAKVAAYDPAVRKLPPDLERKIELCSGIKPALNGAHCAVVATEWPAFRELTPGYLRGCMKQPVVVDMKGFLHSQLGNEPKVGYFAVGRRYP